MTKKVMIKILDSKNDEEACHVIMKALNVDSTRAEEILKANDSMFRWYARGIISVDDLAKFFEV